MRSRYGKVCPTIRRQLFLLLATFSVGLSTVTSAHAATYYVATSGSDSNPGSEAAPFKNVQKAVGVVKAGDTVIIRAGRHRAFALMHINGAEGAPITFKGEPGAIIDRNLGGGNGDRIIEFYGGSYITIDGLELTDSDPITGPIPDTIVEGSSCKKAAGSGDDSPSYGPRQAIKINKSDPHTHHIIFSNLHIHNVANTGILGLADYSQVLNSHIHDLGDKKRGRQAYGLYLKGIGWVIRGNRIYNANGNGIRTGNTPQEGGPVHNLLRDSIIENNIVYDNGGFFGHPSGPTGCRFKHGGEGIIIFHGSGNIIRNNVVYNNVGSGIRVGEDHALSNAPNAVYNNTVYASGKFGIQAISGSDNPGKTTIIKNNISHISGQDEIRVGGIQSNNLTTDPKFVNPPAGDFGLQASSPAIDKGVTLAEVPTDFTGKARPVGPAYDIGAFEGAGSKANVLPGVGAGFPGGFPSGPPILRGPNGEVCPSGYL